MDNPYWETEGHGHHIDVESIKRLSFELLNVFEVVSRRELRSGRTRRGATVEHCGLSIGIEHSPLIGLQSRPPSLMV
jgi:hypothetical protein